MVLRVTADNPQFILDDSFTPPRVVGVKQRDGSEHFLTFTASQPSGATDQFDSAVTMAADATFGLIVQRTSDSTLGGGVKFKHVSASPAANDFVGFFNAYGNDSLGNETLYGSCQFLIADATDGSEKGEARLGAAGGDTLKVGQGIYTNNATPPGVTDVIAARQLKTQARTVAQLPAAATVGAGTRGWVSDSNVAYSTGVITNVVVGGGANGCPVYCDGTNWRIG